MPFESRRIESILADRLKFRVPIEVRVMYNATPSFVGGEVHELQLVALRPALRSINTSRDCSEEFHGVRPVKGAPR